MISNGRYAGHDLHDVPVAFHECGQEGTSPAPRARARWRTSRNMGASQCCLPGRGSSRLPIKAIPRSSSSSPSLPVHRRAVRPLQAVVAPGVDRPCDRSPVRCVYSCVVTDSHARAAPERYADPRLPPIGESRNECRNVCGLTPFWRPASGRSATSISQARRRSNRSPRTDRNSGPPWDSGGVARASQAGLPR